MSALVLGPIQAQQLLLAFDIEPEYRVHGLADVAPVLLDLVVDRVQPDDGVDRLEDVVIRVSFCFLVVYRNDAEF